MTTKAIEEFLKDKNIESEPENKIKRSRTSPSFS